MVVSSLDRRAPRASSRPASKPAPRHQRYAIGVLPLADEVLGVAFIRGGIERVAATLIAEASFARMAHLERAPVRRRRPRPRRRTSRARVAPRPRESRSLSEQGSYDVASGVAAKLAPAIEADLESAGLERSSSTRFAGALPSRVRGGLDGDPRRSAASLRDSTPSPPRPSSERRSQLSPSLASRSRGCHTSPSARPHM